MPFACFISLMLFLNCSLSCSIVCLNCILLLSFICISFCFSPFDRKRRVHLLVWSCARFVLYCLIRTELRARELRRHTYTSGKEERRDSKRAVLLWIAFSRLPCIICKFLRFRIDFDVRGPCICLITMILYFFLLFSHSSAQSFVHATIAAAAATTTKIIITKYTMMSVLIKILFVDLPFRWCTAFRFALSHTIKVKD